MSDARIFWIGFCAGVISGAISLLFVVQFAYWLLQRIHKKG